MRPSLRALDLIIQCATRQSWVRRHVGVCAISNKKPQEWSELVAAVTRTPDGHLMGSLGEAMAVYMYDLVLADPSSETHDATTKDGKTKVQIKFTAGTSGYGIYSKPQHLIALQLRNRNEVVEVFNGPGEIAWRCAGPKSKNDQHRMALGRLKALKDEVPADLRIPQLRQLELVRRA